MYKITIKKSAEKELQKLPSLIIPKVTTAIDLLAINPRPSGSKKLTGGRENIWRIRVGNYRIVYLIADEIRIIEVRRIGHRKDIYKK